MCVCVRMLIFVPSFGNRFSKSSECSKQEPYLSRNKSKSQPWDPCQDKGLNVAAGFSDTRFGWEMKYS